MSKKVSDPNSLPSQGAVQIPGWTKQDKLNLHTALEAVGSNKIDMIAAYVMKSPTEVRKAIEIYKERARACKNQENKKSAQPKAESSNTPLDSWAELIMENSNPEHLQSETANAIRMIAELEDIPNPNYTDNIDFKNIYLTVADAIEEKPLKPDSNARAVIHKCILETARLNKAHAKNIKLEYILEKAVEFDKPTVLNVQHAEDLETSIVREFAAHEAYNPLNLPLEALQTTIAQECKLFTQPKSPSSKTPPS